MAGSLIAAVGLVGGGLMAPRMVAASTVQCTPPIPCVDNTVTPQFEGYALFHQIWAGPVGYYADTLTGTANGLRTTVPTVPLATATTDSSGNVCDPGNVGPCGNTTGPNGCSYYTCTTSAVSWYFGVKTWPGQMGTGTYNGGWFVASPSTSPDCDGQGTCYMHAAHGEFNQVQSYNGDYGICGVSIGIKPSYSLTSESGQKEASNFYPINYDPNSTSYNNSGTSTSNGISATADGVGVSSQETQAGGSETDGGYNANASEYDAHSHYTDSNNPCQDTSISVRSVSDWVFELPYDWDSWAIGLSMPAEYTYRD
jgi:hypothetical protein